MARSACTWDHVRDGVEVKLCASPEGDEETFILCRSRDRSQKEKAIFARFESRIEEGLKKIESSCQKKKQSPIKIAERVGRLQGANSRAARLFDVKIEEGDDGGAKLAWRPNRRPLPRSNPYWPRRSRLRPILPTVWMPDLHRVRGSTKGL